VKSRTVLWTAIALLAIGATALFFLEWRQRTHRSRNSGAAPVVAGDRVRASNDESLRNNARATDVGAASGRGAHAARSLLREQIEVLFEKLVSGKGNARDIAALREALEKADPREALVATLEFLQSGRDVRTGQSFVVAENGRLSESPTLRVMLLDILGALSRQLKSNEADTFARAILETKSSPDEWSIALRNVAWHDPAARPYLSAKARDLLTYAPWRQSPTPGMLEAFDVAVFVQDPNLIPALEENLVTGEAAVQRASAIALDRLAERAPLAVMNYLNANPQLMGERPFVRADYFAKADLGQPAQRAALEFYLGRSDVSHDEKVKLLNALTTPASFVADGLLTAPIPEPDEVARQNAVAETTRTWLAQNRFPPLRSEIIELQRRLRAQ
jgi:hypothetical protein